MWTKCPSVNSSHPTYAYLLVAYPAKRYTLVVFAPLPCKFYYPSRFCTLPYITSRRTKPIRTEIYLRVCVGLRVERTTLQQPYQRGAGVVQADTKKRQEPKPLPEGHTVASVTQSAVLPCDRIARCCVPMQALHDAHGTRSMRSLKRGSDGQDRVPFRLLK